MAAFASGLLDLSPCLNSVRSNLQSYLPGKPGYAGWPDHRYWGGTPTGTPYPAGK